MSAANDFEALLIGFDQVLLDYSKSIFGTLKCKTLATANEIDAFLEGYQVTAGTPVFVSTFTDGMAHFEVAQSLSSYFQGLHLIFLTLDRSKFEIEILKKNGFTESFLLPLDGEIFIELVEEIKNKKVGGGTKKYKAIKLIDLQPGTNLPFEVRTYLPSNKKYVMLTASGQISNKKIELLKTKHTNSVFVDVQEMEKFYEFTATQLLNLGKSSNDAVSETEKAERLRSSVRELFRSLLDSTDNVGTFDDGRELLEQSKKVVEHYLMQKAGLNVTKKFQELIGEGKDLYSHAQIVSTLAFLVSMATEIGKPEDLAIAGLVHDIGIHGMLDNISIFDLDKLGAEERKMFLVHPRTSLNLLKEKRVTVTPVVAEIIEKHHERIDGKGFPAQLSGHRVPLESQLLAYVDAFEYLTRMKPGAPALSPLDAHHVIQRDLGLSSELTIKVEKFLKDI